jgi:hypothetical protein
MMRIATVHAFDAMTMIHVTARVREYTGDFEEPSSIVFECTTTIRGTGEPDEREWLQDVLVGLREEI